MEYSEEIKQEELISGEIPVSELASKLQLKADKLSLLTTDSALVLPDNTSMDGPAGEAVFFHEDAKELMFVLKNAGIPAQLYDDGRSKKSIQWRSATVVLPTLLFAGKAICAGGLGALGTWITNKWLKAQQQEQPTIKARWILFENGMIKEWVSVEGPAKKIVEVLRKRNGNDGPNPPRKRIGR